MVARVDDGGSKKKKSKLGFKVDRMKNYLERIRTSGSFVKGAGAHKASARREPKPVRVKAVTFDAAARAEYLLGMHKRKNERRVTAVIERRRKHRHETVKMRRELREEARQQYNSVAQVPILPNYEFQFPVPTADDGADDESGGGGGGGDDAALRVAAARSAATTTTHRVGVDDASVVTVSVQPLRPAPPPRVAPPAPQPHGARGRSSSLASARAAPTPLVPDDLPPAVMQRLQRVKRENRGPTQQKIKVRAVKELKKINKIKKHSKKGHGKKGKAGKRKNR
jgi:hypothetical protein